MEARNVRTFPGLLPCVYVCRVVERWGGRGRGSHLHVIVRIYLTSSRRCCSKVWDIEDEEWACRIAEGPAGLAHCKWAPDGRRVPQLLLLLILLLLLLLPQQPPPPQVISAVALLCAVQQAAMDSSEYTCDLRTGTFSTRPSSTFVYPSGPWPTRRESPPL